MIADWHIRTQRARANYFNASERRHRLAEELRLHPVPYHDGGFVVERARRAESLALAQYRRVLQIYELVIRGENPPVEDENG